MPDSSHSFVGWLVGWSHICAIFVAILNLYKCMHVSLPCYDVIHTHKYPMNREPIHRLNFEYCTTIHPGEGEQW